MSLVVSLMLLGDVSKMSLVVSFMLLGDVSLAFPENVSGCEFNVIGRC